MGTKEFGSRGHLQHDAFLKLSPVRRKNNTQKTNTLLLDRGGELDQPFCYFTGERILTILYQEGQLFTRAWQNSGRDQQTEARVFEVEC